VVFWVRSYIAKRLLHTALISWGVMTAAFILMRIGPNSPADKYLAGLGAGHNVTQVVAAIESRYGVDKPLYDQYFSYITSLLQGDWGWSFGTSMPVMELIKTHWIYSFQLILLSTIFAVVLGIALGIFAAVRKNTAKIKPINGNLFIWVPPRARFYPPGRVAILLWLLLMRRLTAVFIPESDLL